MSQEDHGGCEVNHPEEVGWVAFPASDDATIVVEPGKEPFDFPSASGPTERPTVLGARTTIWVMPGNQFDPVGLAQMRVKTVTVVAAVADQARRERVEKRG